MRQMRKASITAYKQKKERRTRVAQADPEPRVGILYCGLRAYWLRGSGPLSFLLGDWRSFNETQ
jgi:hypothetical protein